MRTSQIFTPATPLELQRAEDPDADEPVYRVVRYCSATPDEASLPGYRLVDRSKEPPTAAKRPRGGR